MVQQHKYFFSKHKDVRIAIRLSEQEFHKNHAPLYANHLFCNSFEMSKIENHLLEYYPKGTSIVIFDDMREDQCEKLNSGAITCGYELDDGQIDVEATYQIAKHSKNAVVIGFDAINDDDLILVRDDRVSDNTFILMYVPENDDEDDTEIICTPDEKLIYAFA